MTGPRKAALIVAILVVLGALVYVNLTFERATGPEVEVEAVERRALEAVVSASGKIEPKLSVDISASTMGRVTRLSFNEGDRVETGQFLLEIDPETLRAAVDRGEAGLQASRSTQRQAQVSVTSARVNLQLAKDNLERQENLWELRLISRETYELAASDVTLRETELEAREVDVATQAQRIRQEEASLDSARYELTKVTITAPISGVVTRRNIEEGETVVVGTMNNQGTVLATVADLSVIEAEVEVDETDIPSVRLGQVAEVTRRPAGPPLRRTRDRDRQQPDPDDRGWRRLAGDDLQGGGDLERRDPRRPPGLHLHGRHHDRRTLRLAGDPDPGRDGARSGG